MGNGRKAFVVKKLDGSLSPKNIGRLAALTLIYSLADHWGFQLAFAHPFVTPIWIPSGLAFAAFMLLRLHFTKSPPRATQSQAVTSAN